MEGNTHGTEATTKWCANCKQDVPIDQFHLDASRLSGRAFYCRKCVLSRRHLDYHSDSKGRDRKWVSRLKKSYGITPAQYTAMETAQTGACAIYGRSETRQRNGRVRRLAVDHCHDTGRIRGLLCSDCNVGIGLFGDDPARIVAALDYVRRGGFAPQEAS